MSKKSKRFENVNAENDEGPLTGANIYTYIGAGADSPRVINFMDRQKFVRGQATEVMDEIVLKKIINNPTFIQGEATQEQLHTIDEEAAAEEQKTRDRDNKMNAEFSKKHKTE